MSGESSGVYNRHRTSYGIGCVATDIIATDITLEVKGNLKVDGLIDCDNIGPLGPLEKCDGCENSSYGFKWELTDEDNISIERQMCFECLYNIMLIEKVKQREHNRNKK